MMLELSKLLVLLCLPALILVYQLDEYQRIRDDPNIRKSSFGRRLLQETNPEFQVNTYTTNSQDYPRVKSMKNSGGFVVTWQSRGQDGEYEGIYAQRYDLNNTRLGKEFQVNTYTTHFQMLPDIACISSGGFVIIWQSYGQDVYDSGIYAQRYDSVGKTVDSEFKVNEGVLGNQCYPSVAELTGGRFVAVWSTAGTKESEYAVIGRIYESDGQPSGSEFRVSDSTFDMWRTYPRVAGLFNGGFVATWFSNGTEHDVFAQIFDASGSKLGSEFKVNNFTENSQSDPSVAVLQDGRFIITWMSFNQDGSAQGVYGQIYYENGTLFGREFQVNTFTPNSQSYPSVVGLSSGGFAVAWQGEDGSNTGVFAQFFDRNSERIGPEFQLNNYTNNYQNHPSISAMHKDEHIGIIAVWASNGQDGEGYGVFGRTFYLPRLVTNTLTIQQGQIVTLSSNELSATDLDCSDNELNITIKGIAHGYFQSRLNPSVAITRFSQEQVNNQEIQFVHDGSSIAPSYEIVVSDGTLETGPEASSIVFNEFQINSYVNNSQVAADIATWPNGSFIVAWQSKGQDGPDEGTYGKNGYGVYAQIFSADTEKVGSEFRVNEVTKNDQSGASISVLSNEDVIVAWESWEQDGSDWGVYAQCFDFNGQRKGAPYLVNSFTTFGQRYPSVAALRDGKYVITWNSNQQDEPPDSGVFGQRYKENREKDGKEFQINTYTPGTQYRPATASLITGGFVVVWESEGQDPDKSTGIYGQLYSENGAKYNSEFRVNTNTTNTQMWPDVTKLNSGRFVVTWMSYQQGYSSVFAKLYNANGSAFGSEFQVNTQSGAFPSITGLSEGGFVIVWKSYNQEIFGQVFKATGVKIGAEFRVNVNKKNAKAGPSVSSLPNNGFVVVWQSDYQESDGFGIFGRLFYPPVVRRNSMTLVQGETVSLTESCLNVTDCNNRAKFLNVTVKGIAHGYFQSKLNPSVAITRFSQEQVNNQEIQFVHDGSSIAPSYEIVVSDGTLETGPEASSIVFSLQKKWPSVKSLQKLTASDGQASVNFGNWVSISQDGITALIGARYENEKGLKAGAAYIFNYNSGSGQYEELQKLTASDGQADDYFGFCLSISKDGRTALIGAYNEDAKATDAGAAYIFKYNSTGQYEELQKLTASDGQARDNFGISVSISQNGSTALIGATYEDEKGKDAGAAYVFKTNSNGQYEQLQKLMASDGQADDYFGYSVSISQDGSTALIGAYGEDKKGNQAGAAYIFKTNSTGQYQQLQKLTANDGESNDQFGFSVDISRNGNTALIGARYEDEKASNAGAAYIFKYNSGSGQYDQLQKLMASDAEAGDTFGFSVSISQDGITALVGAWWEDEKGSNAGAAYLFKYNSASGQYEQSQNLTASDGQADDYFGKSVSTNEDGSTVLIGAMLEDEKGSGAGAAYIGKAVCPEDYVFIPDTSTCALSMASPTPTPTPSPTASPTAIPTPSPSASPTASPTASPSPSPSPVHLYISSVMPNSGPVTGLTHVNVSGFYYGIDSNLLNVSFVLENGITKTVPAALISIGVISCTTPNFSQPGNVSIHVNGNGDGNLLPKVPVRISGGWFNVYNAALHSLDPSLGPTTGGTRMTLKGSGFVNTFGQSLVRLNSASFIEVFFVSNAEMYCVLPANSNSGSISVDLFLNGQQPTSNQCSFTYYIQPVITGLSPTKSRVQGGYNITIEGSGFFDSPYLHCRFDSVIMEAGFQSDTMVTCSVGDLGTVGVKQTSLTFNGQQYTNSLPFSAVDYVSSSCTAKTELELFRKDREQERLRYFDNLALNGTVETTSLVESVDGYHPNNHIGTVVDGDRCCSYSSKTEGFKCGIVFDTSQSSKKLASLIVTLPEYAYVNEIITSWYRPCFNLPKPGYSIKCANSSHATNWQTNAERVTWSMNPCSTIAGDAGPVSLCADFFHPVIAKAFKLVFNNSKDHFLTGNLTNGGWLFEMEVHGIYLTTPFELWSPENGKLKVMSSAAEALVPSIVLYERNILGELVETLGTGRNITYKLWKCGSLNLTDSETPCLQANQYEISPRHLLMKGQLTVSELTIRTPVIGFYLVQFKANRLEKSVMQPLKVVPGSPFKLHALNSTLMVESDVTVVLRRLCFEIKDAAGNSVQTGVQHVTLTNQGVFVQSVASVNGTAVFDYIDMSRSPKGSFVFTASSPGLLNDSFTIVVSTGLPYAVNVKRALNSRCFPFQSPPVCDDSFAVCCRSAIDTKLPIFEVSVVDASLQNEVDLNSFPPLVAKVELYKGETVMSNFNGTVQKTMETDKRTGFMDLLIFRPITGQYTLVFEAGNLQKYSQNINITAGDPFSVEIISSTFVSGPYRCENETKLEPITTQLLDSGGTPTFPETEHVTVKLRIQSDSAGKVYEFLQSVDSTGRAIFDYIRLAHPVAGRHTVVAFFLDRASVPRSIEIVPGPGVELSLVHVIETVWLQTGRKALLPSMEILEKDAGNNQVNEHEAPARNISVSVNPGTLYGLTSFTMIGGRLNLTGIWMNCPIVDKEHILGIQSSLVSPQVKIRFEKGTPASLSALSVESSTKPFKAILFVKDECGNSLSSGDATIRWKVSPKTKDISYNNDQNATVDSNGEAVFDNINIVGWHGKQYELEFYVVGNEALNEVVNVTLPECYSGAGPDPDAGGTQCICSAGHERANSECLKCQEGFYKSEVGDFQCRECSGQYKTTYIKGSTSPNDCVCQNYYFMPATSTECFPCNRPLNCQDGIVELEGGYWRADKTPWVNLTMQSENYYKCIPDEACSGGTQPWKCTEHYTGILCAQCTPEGMYAKSGKKCVKCSSSGLNVVLLLLILVLIFLLLVFLVQKQMLGERSPASTVLKVIVNFLQTTGFVLELVEGGPVLTWFSDWTMTLGNSEIFRLQPIDCALQPNFYSWFIFYCCAIPVSLLIPYVMYKIGRLPWFRAFRVLSHQKGEEISVRIGSSVERRMSQIRRASVSKKKEASILSKILWPFLFVFVVAIPSMIISVFRLPLTIWRFLSPRFLKIGEKITGDPLVKETITLDTLNSTSNEDSEKEGNIVSSVSIVKAREHARSIGGKLFEDDPLQGSSPWSAATSSFWILFFFFLPAILRNTMALYVCLDVQVGDATISLLKLNNITQCYTTTWRVFSYIFAIVLVPTVISLLTYVFYKNAIKRKRRELVSYLHVFQLCWVDKNGELQVPEGVDKNTKEVLIREITTLRMLRKYLFLFAGYRTEGILYMWDLVIMCRKITIAVILVFVREYLLRYVLLMLTFVAAVSLHLHFKPFDDDYARKKRMRVAPAKLEFMSLLTTLFTLIISLLLFEVENEANSSVLPLIAEWLIIIVNGGLMIVLVFLLFDAVLTRLAKKFVSAVYNRASQIPVSPAAKWWKGRVKHHEKRKEAEWTDLSEPLLEYNNQL